jgi:hypothetical protein
MYDREFILDNKVQLNTVVLIYIHFIWAREPVSLINTKDLELLKNIDQGLHRPMYIFPSFFLFYNHARIDCPMN